MKRSTGRASWAALTVGLLALTAGCSDSTSTASAGATSAAASVNVTAGPQTTNAPTAIPPTAPVKGSQESVLNALPGSKSGSCATVGKETDLRSGQVAVGNFATAKAKYTADVKTHDQPTVSFYVIPRNAKARRAVVKVAPVGHPGSVRKVTATTAQQAEAWNYFAINVPISSPGTWRLTATTGHDSGCFDVTFTK